MLKRFFFTLENALDNGVFVVEFIAETAKLAMQEYEETLGWCADYKILKIAERNPDEPLSNDFITGLFVASSHP